MFLNADIYTLKSCASLPTHTHAQRSTLPVSLPLRSKVQVLLSHLYQRVVPSSRATRAPAHRVSLRLSLPPRPQPVPHIQEPPRTSMADFPSQRGQRSSSFSAPSGDEVQTRHSFDTAETRPRGGSLVMPRQRTGATVLHTPAGSVCLSLSQPRSLRRTPSPPP